MRNSLSAGLRRWVCLLGSAHIKTDLVVSTSFTRDLDLSSGLIALDITPSLHQVKLDSADKSMAIEPEKLEAPAQHHETLPLGDKQPEVDLTHLAEDVSYGAQGVMGFFSSGPYVLTAAFLASLGGFSFGYDQGVMGIVNVLPQFHAVIPQAATAFGKGLMTGMLLLGAFVGCWFYPYVSDRWSRKKALFVSSVIFVLGGVIQTASYDYATLVVGRAIGGVGTGTLALGAPMVCRRLFVLP